VAAPHPLLHLLRLIQRRKQRRLLRNRALPRRPRLRPQLVPLSLALQLHQDLNLPFPRALQLPEQLPGRVVRPLTVHLRHPVGTDKLARQHPAKDIRRALELRQAPLKADRRKDIAPLLRGRLDPEVLQDKVAPALLGQEVERHRAFRNAPVAAARDKTR